MTPDSISTALAARNENTPALLPPHASVLPEGHSVTSAHQAQTARNTVPAENFWTVAETAALLRLSKMTVYRLVHGGQLESLRFGRSIRIRESSIRACLRKAEENGEQENAAH
jgi:excisionase family DNA binding protein